MGYLSILSDRRRERLYKDYDDDDGRRRAGKLWSDNLTPQTRGSIFKTDFDDISEWTNDGTFSKVADDALIAFDPLPIYLSATPLSIDRTGVREPTAFIDNNILSVIYDGGDGTLGWYNQLAQSTDGGKTWVKSGIVGPGHDNGTAAIVRGVGMGWIYKEDGIYYFYRLTAANISGTGIPNPPYYGDIWSSSSLSGPWTFISIIPDFTGTWANKATYPGSIIKVGAVYYFFIGAMDVAGTAVAGILTSSTPFGPWTVFNPVVLDQTILGDLRRCENAKIFYHPILEKYVCLNNLTNADHTNTDQNGIQIASSITDFASGSLRRLQALTEMDASLAVGTITFVSNLGNDAIIGNNSFIPALFDSDGKGAFPYHERRDIKVVMLEPSRNVLRFNGSVNGAIYKAQLNSDFIAEFGVQFNSYTVGELMAFIFRSDGSEDNEYNLQVQNGGEKLVLIKIVSGISTIIQTATASQTIIPQMINRIKIAVNGTSIKAYINGQLQIDVADSALSSGSHIGFRGKNGENTDVRLLSIISNDTVTLNDLPIGVDVDIMADGGIISDTTCSNNSGIAVFTLKHYPMDAFRINGKTYTVSGGIYGGDVYSFNKAPITGFTPNDSLGTTKLLLHFENNVVDSSATPITVINNNVTFGTTWGKFGYYGIFSKGKYLTIPSLPALDVGIDDFTIDFWIYPTALGSLQFICGQCDASATPISRQFNIYYAEDRHMHFSLWDDTHTELASSIGLTVLLINKWHHIALVRNGNIGTLYVNGAMDCILDMTGKILQYSSEPFIIGKLGSYSTDLPFIGNIDEFRFTRGIARWTKNFTPMSAQYDPDI